MAAAATVCLGSGRRQARRRSPLVSSECGEKVWEVCVWGKREYRIHTHWPTSHAMPHLGQPASEISSILKQQQQQPS